MPRPRASSRVLDYVLAGPWAMEHGVYARMLDIVVRWTQGDAASEEEVSDIVAARDRDKEPRERAYENINGIGVVPITGVIARHASQVNGISQPRGTSLEQLRANLAEGLADKRARAMVLAIDSPGGSVAGLEDAADAIFEAREQKPIYAHVDGLMASAAYWLGAQASQVFSTKGSRIGSIGVIATTADWHRLLEGVGIDVRHVVSTPAKGAGHPGAATTPSDFAVIQSEVDAIHESFVEAVARGRGVELAAAAAWADARVHHARAAARLGLVDELASLDHTLDVLRSRHASRASASVTGPEMGTSQELPEGETMSDTTKVAPQATDPAGGSPAEGTQPAAAPPATAPAATPAPATAPAAAPAQDAQAIATAAIQAERERVAFIQSKAGAGQQGLAAKLIAEGASQLQALDALLTDANSRLGTSFAQQTGATDGQNAALGGGNTPANPKPSGRAPQTLEQRWEAMHPAERAEFANDFELFAAYERGVADGFFAFEPSDKAAARARSLMEGGD